MMVYLSCVEREWVGEGGEGGRGVGEGWSVVWEEY
jgi:hypothetical protein|tara:strand:- start:1302 stop:1406 length:105 start_codon:yes stop_codon:yes gene_type:complete